LLREAVDAKSLEVFKVRLDGALCSLNWWVVTLPVAGSAACQGSETLEHVAQKGCGCSLPENIQGQGGWGFEQPGLEVSLPTVAGLELGDLQGPLQPILLQIHTEAVQGEN